MYRIFRAIIISVILSGIALACLSCELPGKSGDFTVEMQGGDGDTLRLGVDLPSSGSESDIVFYINDTAYELSSLPTVQNNRVSFNEVDADGFQTISLDFPDSTDDDFLLYITTDDGKELSYSESAAKFDRLLDYLKHN